MVYSKAKDCVIARYFGASSATEFAIPPLELRHRYPHSGLRHSPEDQVDVAAGVHPVRFEAKGNYGVSVHWSDGYFTDIIPFDVLKKVAQEVAGSSADKQ